MAAPAQQSQVQLQAHKKHEQQQPDLTQGIQKPQRACRKQLAIDVRGHEAQQRWSEQDAREHLAHHLRLAQPSQQPAEGARGHNDHDYLQEQNGQSKPILCQRSKRNCCCSAARKTGVQSFSVLQDGNDAQYGKHYETGVQ